MVDPVCCITCRFAFWFCVSAAQSLRLPAGVHGKSPSLCMQRFAVVATSLIVTVCIALHATNVALEC